MNITFEDFVRTRHAMWLEKTYGIPVETWLADTTALDVMRNYRFTNVWRELDRGTLEVLALQDKYLKISTLRVAVYHTLLYRFFNLTTGYYRYLRAISDAGEEIKNPSADTINAVLDHAGNFSGAYIRTIKRSLAVSALQSLWGHAGMIATALDEHKGLIIRATYADMIVDLHADPLILKSVKEVRALFGAVPSFGNFLADQLMLDFSWQGNPWELEFTPGLGPGAKRGLERTGMTFDDAVAAGNAGLQGMPRPHVAGTHLYYGDAVRFGAVEAEHMLCEAEKLWKIIDAVAENSGRQVKMRKYSGDVRPTLDAAMPANWSMQENWRSLMR